jgi:hypothetical protein
VEDFATALDGRPAPSQLPLARGFFYERSKEMTGLEKLVEENICELKEGIAYVAVGKRRPSRGSRPWEMIVIYNEGAERREFGNIRHLINDDENTILFNTYNSAWVGFTEEGEYKSIRDVANRIKTGYENGRCRATHDDVDALMPEDLRAEMMAEVRTYEGEEQEGVRS